jgi:hypothetical protein
VINLNTQSGQPVLFHKTPSCGCIEAHDLAASKLAAYREKDKEFVRLLLIEKMIDAKILKERISSLNVKEQLRERLLLWVKITAEELQGSE